MVQQTSSLCVRYIWSQYLTTETQYQTLCQFVSLSSRGLLPGWLLGLGELCWVHQFLYTVMYNMTILQLSSLIGLSLLIVLQWNPSITDTIGTQYFVRYSEISPTQGLPVYSGGRGTA